MFYGCERLEELDLSRFNTAGVTSMSNMFCRCSALKRIVFTGLDLSNVTDMQYAFSECESLEELRVGDDSPANRPNIAVTGIFDQSPRVAVHSHGSILTPDEWLGNETAEPQTVRDADKIPNDQTVSHVEWERSTVAEQMPDPSTTPAPETWSAPVPEKWPVPEPEPAQDEVRAGDDAGSAPRMRGEALTVEELENRKGTVLGSDISRGEVQYITFADSLEAAPSGAWDVSEAGDGSVMAWISNGELTVAGRGGVKAPGNATGLFANYTSLRGVSFNGCFLTTETADMSYMFYGDEQLMELDCAGFDTFRVQSMRAMFCGCSGLEALDVSGFITDNVMDMSDMFNGCSRLKALDVSRFATGKVAGMRSMFNGCSRLEALNVSGFDTKQVRDMGFMFRGCEDIESLNLAGFDTTNVSDMQSMFAECRSLTELDLSRFNTGSVGNFSRMFMECTRLDKLLVSDAFVALGDPFPENGDMVTRGPLQIQNGDDVIDAEQWQQNMRIDSGLHKGDKGTSVKWIQRVLTKLSYLDGKIDGVFGTKTQNALMEFQGKCGLESSGVADDGTLKALARQVLE
jgi:surface protein